MNLPTFRRRLAPDPETVLALVLILAMAALLLWALASFRSFRTSEESTELVAHTYQVREALHAVLSTLTDAETADRGYLLTGQDQFLEPYNAAPTALARVLDEVAALTRDNPTQQQALAGLRSLVQAKMDLLREQLALYRQRGPPAAHQAIASGNGKEAMDRVRAQVATMLQEEQRLLTARLALHQAAAHRMQFVLLYGSIALLVVLAGSATLLYHRHLPASSSQSLSLFAQAAPERLWLGYALALAGVAAAAALRWELGRALGQTLPPYITFYPAIILAALYGGAGAGILATVLSAGTVAFLFLEPTGSLWVEKPVDLVGVAIFTAINLMLCVLAGSLRGTRRRTEAQARQLAQSEQRYRSFVEATNQVVWRTNPGGEADQPMPSWNAFTGQTEEQSAGLGWLDAIHPDDRPRVTAAWQAASAAKAIFQVEYRLQRHDGQWREVVARAVPVLEFEGQVREYLGTCRDITERKHAESTAARMAAIIESSNDAILSITLEGVVTSWNPAAERLFGYSPAQILGHPIRRITPPGRHNETAGFLERVRAGKPVRQHETVRQASDGRLIDVKVTLSPIRDSAGQLVGASEIIHDITERKQAEKALRESEQRLRSFIEATNHVIWSTNPNGEVDQPIPSWNAFTGQTDQQAGGFGWMQAIHPDDRSRVTEAWQAASAAKALYQVEYRLRRHDGQWRYILARGVPVLQPDGQVREFIGTCMDITEQRQAQEDLRRSERYFRALADSVPQLVWTTDAEGRVDYISPQWTSLTGQALEQALDYGWAAVLHPDDGPRTLEGWAAAARAGQLYESEHRLRSRDGQYRWFLNRAVPLRDAHGRPERWFGTSTDITHQKQTEDALRQSEERYRTLFNAIDQGFCILELLFDENQKPRDYRFLQTNPAFEQHTGLPNAQGKRMRELAPLHEDFWFETYGRVALTGQPVRFEHWAEQLHRWLDVYAFRFGPWEQRQIALLFSDITGRKQAEEALRASEHFNRSLVESSLDCIKTLDLEGKLLSMSAGGQRLLEIPDLAPYLDTCWIDFWKEEDRPRVAEAITAARNAGTGRFQAFALPPPAPPSGGTCSSPPSATPRATLAPSSLSRATSPSKSKQKTPCATAKKSSASPSARAAWARGFGTSAPAPSSPTPSTAGSGISKAARPGCRSSSSTAASTRRTWKR